MAIKDKGSTQVRHHAVVFEDVVVAVFIGSAHLHSSMYIVTVI